MNGYWEELVNFIRSLFNSAFKTNPYLERAVMTGVTRISKESIFSDLNNLEVITTTSEKYADSFGFTESEVLASLEEFGLSAKIQEVKLWYDGFTFGRQTDIYNYCPTYKGRLPGRMLFLFHSANFHPEGNRFYYIVLL